MNYTKVKGHDNLLKNEYGAVINTDKSALQKAKELKRKRLEEIERVQTLEEKVKQLEDLVSVLIKDK